VIGIEQIAHYIPASRISNLERRERFGVTEEFILGKIGISQVARKGREEETSDMCLRAYEALARKTPVRPDEVDCIVVCTQNPDGDGLPHTSAVLHGKLACPDSVAAFDVSLGCSGYVYCLAIASAFMESAGLRKGLLFTADPYSKILDDTDKNTALLFSDAATVTLLGPAPVFAMRAAEFATRGQEASGLHSEGGVLRMNGRAIFNFSMTAVPEQIRRVAEKSGLALGGVDVFLFHQASKYLVDALSGRLGIDPRKVPSNLSETGNTVSSSIPLLLEERLEDAGANILLLSGFGVGLSWATAILGRTRAAPGGRS
jgi:3-oxoacyl-[acyl-carrier-protein] synthase-3